MPREMGDSRNFGFFVVLLQVNRQLGDVRVDLLSTLQGYYAPLGCA